MQCLAQGDAVRLGRPAAKELLSWKMKVGGLPRVQLLVTQLAHLSPDGPDTLNLQKSAACSALASALSPGAAIPSSFDIRMRGLSAMVQLSDAALHPAMPSPFLREE